MNPWGVIIAACITGFIAFLGMLISKENKTSEFRQAWIDGLREDVVILIGAWKGFLDSKDSSSSLGEDAGKLNFENALELKKSANRIKLRLNADKEKRTSSEQKLYQIMDEILNNQEIRTPDGTMNDLTDTSGLVLKEEWERVKTGEKWFTRIRWFLIIFVTLIAIVLIVWLVIHVALSLGVIHIPTVYIV